MNGTTSDARRAGAALAHDLVTALADAGNSPDQIDAAAEAALTGRPGHTTLSRQFRAEFDHTTATYVTELRELEAG